MNRTWFVGLGIITIVIGIWAGSVASGQGRPADDKLMQDASYAIGFDLGEEIRKGLEADGVDANLERLLEGFRDGLRSTDPAVDRETMDDALITLQERVAEREAARRMQSDPVYQAMASENARRGAIFRKKFAEKEGVRELGDGVYYMVVKESEGASPSATDTVVVDYQGLLINGEEFQRGRLAEVEVDETLPGAQKILTRMQVGERWYVAVPPELAYGLAGRIPDIGPNETLLFDVTLVDIK